MDVDDGRISFIDDNRELFIGIEINKKVTTLLEDIVFWSHVEYGCG